MIHFPSLLANGVEQPQQQNATPKPQLPANLQKTNIKQQQYPQPKKKDQNKVEQKHAPRKLQADQTTMPPKENKTKHKNEKHKKHTQRRKNLMKEKTEKQS